MPGGDRGVLAAGVSAACSVLLKGVLRCFEAGSILGEGGAVRLQGVAHGGGLLGEAGELLGQLRQGARGPCERLEVFGSLGQSTVEFCEGPHARGLKSSAVLALQITVLTHPFGQMLVGAGSLGVGLLDLGAADRTGLGVGGGGVLRGAAHGAGFAVYELGDDGTGRGLQPGAVLSGGVRLGRFHGFGRLDDGLLARMCSSRSVRRASRRS